MKSPNEHIWLQHGITAEGCEVMDELMDYAMDLASYAPSQSCARSALEEALFQTFELPTRSKEFQDKARWRETC